jgi:hypothetical protein
LVGYGMREKGPRIVEIGPSSAARGTWIILGWGWLAGFRKHPWSAGRAPRVWPPGLPSIHPWSPGHDRPLWGRRGTAVGYLKKKVPQWAYFAASVWWEAHAPSTEAEKSFCVSDARRL